MTFDKSEILLKKSELGGILYTKGRVERQPGKLCAAVSAERIYCLFPGLYPSYCVFIAGYLNYAIKHGFAA